MQKIKVSLIGYGYWGAKLARNFQNSNFFNLVSIIDTSQKNLYKAKKDFPLVNTNKNYNGLNKIINSRMLNYKKKYKINEMRDILLDLRNIDIIIKSSSINNSFLFKPMLLKICKGIYG